eukprot:Skav205300  [mRNA]  locus=scaffold1587:185231:195176:- [translate_table: standard]
MREAQDMSKASNGSFTYEVTLGPNGWEQFYLLRNNSWSKKIYPAVHKSWKDMPCVGPHKGRERQMCWQLSGRPSWDLPGEDQAPVGSRFCITFTPGKVKRLSWEKLEDEPQKDYCQNLAPVVEEQGYGTLYSAVRIPGSDGQ